MHRYEVWNLIYNLINKRLADPDAIHVTRGTILSIWEWLPHVTMDGIIHILRMMVAKIRKKQVGNDAYHKTDFGDDL